MSNIQYREYDPPTRPGVEYFKSLSMEELDRLIEAKERELQEKRNKQ